MILPPSESFPPGGVAFPVASGQVDVPSKETFPSRFNRTDFVQIPEELDGGDGIPEHFEIRFLVFGVDDSNL